jgi:integrase
VALAPEAFLFTGRTGRPLWAKTLRKHWNAATETVGVSGMHFHDCRHFAATVAGQNGATVSDLMQRGGWSSPSMVARYVHASPERDRQIAAKMDALAAGVATPESADTSRLFASVRVRAGAKEGFSWQ